MAVISAVFFHGSCLVYSSSVLVLHFEIFTEGCKTKLSIVQIQNEIFEFSLSFTIEVFC